MKIHHAYTKICSMPFVKKGSQKVQGHYLFLIKIKLMLAFETKERIENNNNSRTFSFFGSNLILNTFLDAPSNSTTIASAEWLKMFNSTVLQWP